jgi:hypothetical protein
VPPLHAKMHMLQGFPQEALPSTDSSLTVRDAISFANPSRARPLTPCAMPRRGMLRQSYNPVTGWQGHQDDAYLRAAESIEHGGFAGYAGSCIPDQTLKTQITFKLMCPASTGQASHDTHLGLVIVENRAAVTTAATIRLRLLPR